MGNFLSNISTSDRIYVIAAFTYAAMGILFVGTGIVIKRISILLLGYGLLIISYLLYRIKIKNLKRGTNFSYSTQNYQVARRNHFPKTYKPPIHCKNHNIYITMAFQPIISNGQNQNNSSINFDGIFIKKNNCNQTYPNYIAKHKRQFVIDEYLCDSCYNDYYQNYSEFEKKVNINKYYFNIPENKYFYYGKKNNAKYIYIIGEIPHFYNNKTTPKKHKYNLKNPINKNEMNELYADLLDGITEFDIDLNTNKLDEMKKYNNLIKDMDKNWIHVYNKENKKLEFYLEPFYFEEKNYVPIWTHNPDGFKI